MFSIPHRAPDQDYPSPPTSIPSPGPHSHVYHADHYPYQPPPTLSQGAPNDGAGSPYPQPSSIGPVRVPHTRRHTNYQQDLLGRRSTMPSFPRGDKDVASRHNFVTVPLGSAGSRPHSPSTFEFDRPQSHSGRLELNLNHSGPLQAQSPYNPVTPTSLSSPYSPYNQRPVHSRSDSETLPAADRRPASPAVSVASALTSASSGSMTHHHHYPSYPVASSSKDVRPHEKHKKAKLTDLDRKAICMYALEHTNKRQEDIANHFHVERSTISKILKNKDMWLKVEEGTQRIAKHRPSKFPMVEQEMEDWIKDCDEKDRNMSDSMIREKAREIARSFHITEDRFKASAGWVENFKHRNHISRGVWVLGKRRKTNGDYIPSAVTMNPPDDSQTFSISAILASAPSDIPRGNEHDMTDREQQIRHADDAPRILDSSAGQQHSWQQRADETLQPVDGSLHHTSEAKDGMSEPVSPLVHQHPEPAAPLPAPSHMEQVDSYPAPAAYVQPYGGPNEPPTFQQAEEAINQLIHFLDTTGQGIIQPDERDVLTTIKQALFQFGSDLPYSR